MFEAAEQEIETQWSKARRVASQAHFLKGPIPLEDIAVAAKLPGQALSTFLAIHHRAALTGCRSVTVPKGLLERLGISRDAKGRALHALAEASLIAVERDAGKTARVTLLDRRPVTADVGRNIAGL